MKKMLRNVFMMSLIFVFILAGTLFISADEALAANANVAYYVKDYSGSQVKEYKESQKAPKPASAETKYQDWIFAGWYTDDDCSNALSSTVDQNATYYAKYVPSEVLSVKCQVTKGTTVDTDKSDMRLVSTVDSLQYKRVGFEVYFNGATTPVVVNTTKVYERIVANESGIGYDFSSKIFDVQSEYFVTATLKNISGTNFEKGFYIKPYWETLDGTVVYGVDRYARVEDSYLGIVNIPIRLYADTEITTGAFSVRYDDENFEYVSTGYGTLTTPSHTNGNVFDEITVTASSTAGVLTCVGQSSSATVADGTYAHLRFKMLDPTTNPKKNEFKVQDASFINNTETVSISVSDVVYMYFFKSVTGTADTAWYSASKDAYVLTSLDELLGFASLSNTNAFLNKTIYLGADITYHTGDASTWSTTAPTTYSGAKWDPIGNTSTYRFAGTFDGQMHTISGVYASGLNNQGFFQRPTATSIIKNFSLVDSHFNISNTGNGFRFVGSVSAAGEGNFENIYSNAYVSCTGAGAGGILGYANINGSNVKMKNCWYDGIIKLSDSGAHAGGFVGGVGYTSGNTKYSANLVMESCLYTGQIQYSVTEVPTLGIKTGGFIGCILNSSSVSIKDSLVAGKLTGLASKADTGALVGNIESTSNLQVEEESTYATSDAYEKVVGTGTIAEGSVTSVAKANTTYNFGAYDVVSGLNFYDDYTGKSNEGVWVARVGNTPALKSFVETGIFCVPDTSWHNTSMEVKEDGTKVYEISTVEDLYGFAKLSATTNFAGEEIRLANDISVNKGDATNWAVNKPINSWIPVGLFEKTGNAFAGTFDGQGHAISGIYLSHNSNNYGLFAGISTGSLLKNFSLTNSYMSTDNKTGNTHFGAIVGYGCGTLQTIYTDAIIVSSGNRIGGMFGCINGVGDTIIDDCWFNGTIQIKGSNKYVGGLIGYVTGNNVKATLSHCLVKGELVCNNNETIGGVLGGIASDANVTLANSFVDVLFGGTVKSSGNGLILGSLDNPTTSVLNIDEKDSVFATTGTMNNLLGNYSKASTDAPTSTAWVDNVITRGAATFYGRKAFVNASSLSYYDKTEDNGYWVAQTYGTPLLASFADSGVMYRPDTSWYSNEQIVRMDVINGINVPVYVIDSVQDFYGFTVLSETESFVNKKIELTVDLVLNEGNSSDWATEIPENHWIPVGYSNNSGNPFEGIFDGLGHTISGVYVYGNNNGTINAANNLGLFGKTTGASTLKRFSLKNSYVESTSVHQGNVHIGAIVGSGSGTFDTIYTDAIVTTSGNGVGGFMGRADSEKTATFTNCWFDGTINMNGTSHHGGGLIGSVAAILAGSTASGATVDIDNYLYTGTIVYKATHSNYTRVGGFFGAVLGTSVVTIKDSLVAGEINSTRTSSHIASSIGVVGGGANVSVAEGDDCYVTKQTYTTRFNQISSGKEYFQQVEDIKTLYGTTAQTTASSFDFTTYWKTVTGSTPILKCFESDRRWYDGTATEFVINTVAEFYGFAEVSVSNNFAGKIVKLGSDITINSGDAADWATTAPEKVWYPIGFKSGSGTPFAGTFDGQGHTISGVYVSGANNLGLFGKVDAIGTLKNFRLENSYITTTSDRDGKNVFVGTIVGSGGGTYEKIYSNAIVRTSGNGVGGFAGCLNLKDSSVKISECWFDGIVENHGTGKMAGGYVGSVGYDAKPVDLKMSDCLFTGSVHFNSQSQDYARVGGFIGIVLAGSSAEIADSLSIGTVTTIAPEKVHGSIVGHVGDTSSVIIPENGDVYTTKATYQKAIGYKGTSISEEITKDENGEEIKTQVTKDNVTGDDFIHNLNTPSDFYGLGAYLHGRSLDFDTTWSLREGTYPIPTCFVNEDVGVLDIACFEAEGMIARDEFVEYGNYNYQAIKESTEKAYYDEYIAALLGSGFEVVYENAEGLDNGAVCITICQKDNLFFTVTYADNIDTTYISVTTNLALSEYLNEDYVANNGGNQTNGDVTLSMLALEKASGSNYIMQLENGHFVIYDSGETELDRDNMIAYMRSLNGNTTPIIDAWIISHIHADHFAVLRKFVANDEGVIDDVYVQGVYMNVPSQAVFEQANGTYASVTNLESTIHKMRMADGKTVPVIYRMQTGQKYYFDGIAMDVMMTQEQTTGYTDLNDSSVWCMFTVNKTSEKILMGADAGKIGMQKVMDIYSANYLYSDVFTGLHHGINIWNDFTEYCKTNTICNGKAVDDVVLYSRKLDPTNINGYTIDEIGDIGKAINYVTVNNQLLNAVNKGINGNKYFYYGQGTIRLTFGSDEITSEIISQ